ncbi:hypothetical protein CFC21_072994, partial [Triticum aestivum]
GSCSDAHAGAAAGVGRRAPHVHARVLQAPPPLRPPRLLHHAARHAPAHRAGHLPGRGARPPRGRLRPRHPLPPPPRRRPPGGRGRGRGLHRALHPAPRAPRPGRRRGDVLPRRRARARPLRGAHGRRGPRAGRAVLGLHVLHRRHARAHAAPARAPPRCHRGVRRAGRGGARARAAAGTAGVLAVPGGGQEEPQLHVVRAPRRQLHGRHGDHRQHSGRARAGGPRGRRRRPRRGRAPRAAGVPHRLRALARQQRQQEGFPGATAPVRRLAGRAAAGVGGVPLLREHGLVRAGPGGGDHRRAGAVRPPLPVGPARPAFLQVRRRRAGRVGAPDGREPGGAAPGGVLAEDGGQGPGVADVGAAEGDPGAPGRGGIRDARRVELGAGEPVARHTDGAMDLVRGAAPERVRAGRRHGRRRVAVPLKVDRKRDNFVEAAELERAARCLM